MTPLDVRDRRPTGWPPAPRRLLRGCRGRPLPLLSAASEPHALRPGEAQALRTCRGGRGAGRAGGVEFPGPPDLVPRSTRPPAPPEGPCHRPRPEGWETESQASRSKPPGTLPRGPSGPGVFLGDVWPLRCVQAQARVSCPPFPRASVQKWKEGPPGHRASIERLQIIRAKLRSRETSGVPRTASAYAPVSTCPVLVPCFFSE